jgi:hypothetical protein
VAELKPEVKENSLEESLAVETVVIGSLTKVEKISSRI